MYKELKVIQLIGPNGYLLKSVVFSFLVMLCFVLSAQETNVDSLKSELKTANQDTSDCFIVLEIFKHYNALEQVDSTNLYARQVLNVCGLVDNQEYLSVDLVIKEQFKQGFSDNITPLIDSIIAVTEDPDIKLEFLVKVAQDCYFFDSDDQFNKYWSQAQKAFINAEKDYSKFYYYGMQGTKNSGEGRLISALQSIKLAATFKDVSPDLYLFNEYELANVYNATGDHDNAIEVCLDLLKDAKELDMHMIVQYSYYQLLISFLSLNNYDEVIRLAFESIDYTIEQDLQSSYGYAYFNIGQSYLELSKLPFEETAKDSERIDNHVDNAVLPNYLDSVKHYAHLGVKISQEFNDTRDLAYNYNLLSDYYKILGDNKKAISYLMKSKKLESDFNDEELDKKFAALLANDGNYAKAYYLLNEYMEIDSLKDENNAKDVKLAIDIIQDSYKYKEEAEKKLWESAEKEKRSRNIIILTLLGLLLSSFFLMYIQRNRKKLKLLNTAIYKRNQDLNILTTKQKESIKYLDNFASVAAHDLKAPIRTASSFASLLSNRLEDQLVEKDKNYLNYISSSVAQLSEMIDDLLSLSRLDVNLPEPEQVSLNDIVIEVKSLLYNLLNKTDSKIIIESPLPKIIGHATLISQLFQNIIKNAIVHNKTTNPTVVKISFDSLDNDMYTIKISDNAGGIPDYIVPIMFDLFSSSDKNSGNGIGLATCEKIVNHYGGKIWVDVNPGVGSTFNFQLIAQRHVKT